MALTHTHTYVTLEVTSAAYFEIRKKLKAAKYDHKFLEEDDGELIEMSGIALKAVTKKKSKK